MEAVPGLVRELYAVVTRLEEQFPGRSFTPDGHLVGSLGEGLAAHAFGLQLMTASNEGYDAVAPDGRTVEVKATQGTAVAVQAHVAVPEALLVLRLGRDGTATTVYNGPAAAVWEHAGKPQKNGQRRIGLATLRRLMADVPAGDRLRQVRPLP